MKSFLDELSDNALAALPYLFEYWALPHQFPPNGDWRYWILTGGRGAGKTRAGAEWVRQLVEGARPQDPGAFRRIALLADTIDQAREVMVMGESGILACSPPDRRPHYNATRKLLEWPNGATAQLFSAQSPEALRGPQFDAAWCDEFAKWRKVREVWDMLELGLRLGDDPKVMITTTPRRVGLLRELMKDPNSVCTHAPTSANRANLSPRFVSDLLNRFAGTALAKQEIEGEFIDDIDGALWQYSDIEASRCNMPKSLTRVCIAVDPPVTSHANSDECGIVVVGVDCESDDPRLWRGYVMADLSIQGHPEKWARRVVEAYHEFEANFVIAEVNQGGDMIKSMLDQIDPLINFHAARATKGKSRRAEPISALYKQNRVFHCAVFEQLEAQMLNMTLQKYVGKNSPDRLDAMVWGLNALMIEPAAKRARPRLRHL